MKKYVVAAFAALFVAGGVQAGTINFNTSKGWTQGFHTYSGGGVTVKAKAANVNYKGEITSISPYLASWGGYHGGLGICNPGTDRSAGRPAGCYKDEHTIDGKGPNEYVILDFGHHKVDITSITFSYVDRNDDFDIVVYNDGPWNKPTDTAFDRRLPNNKSVVTSSNFDVESGSMFGIGAYGRNDDFKIKAIHFDVHPIPLPATGIMLLAGLGGLAAMKRRKKA